MATAMRHVTWPDRFLFDVTLEVATENRKFGSRMCPEAVEEDRRKNYRHGGAVVVASFGKMKCCHQTLKILVHVHVPSDV